MVDKTENDKIKRIFMKSDANKNGVLDRKEFSKIFKQLLHELGDNFPEKKHMQVEEEAIENFDLNQNGQIEFSEFYNLMRFLIDERGYLI